MILLISFQVKNFIFQLLLVTGILLQQLKNLRYIKWGCMFQSVELGAFQVVRLFY